MRRLMVVSVALLLSFNLYGCLDLGVGDLLTVETPFVVRGTMSVSGGGGACLVWQAENGQRYYLYQDTLLNNDTFDRVTTPGVTSRLVVAVRNDLVSPCTVDAVVQVAEVLEIVE